MLKAVLFDLDHTLIDWDHAEPWEVYQARRLKTVFEFVRRDMPLQAGADADSFFTAFASGLSDAWSEGMKTLRAPSVMRVLSSVLTAYGVPEDRLDMDALMHYYNWQPAQGERAFPDVLEVLPEIQAHGVELGIITNASLPMAYRDRELAAAGILDLFPNCRVAAVDVGVLKPHRQIFDYALDLLGVQPDEAVFVGDNIEADVQGAQRVGMYGVLRPRPGDPGPDDLDIEPDGTITTLHDLPPLLDQWYPGWRSNGHVQ